MTIEIKVREIINKAYDTMPNTFAYWEIENAIVRALLESEEIVIKERSPVKYGCHCEVPDIYPKPDGCVIDEGKRHDCTYAERGIKKEDCEYWQPIKED